MSQSTGTIPQSGDVCDRVKAAENALRMSSFPKPFPEHGSSGIQPKSCRSFQLFDFLAFEAVLATVLTKEKAGFRPGRLFFAWRIEPMNCVTTDQDLKSPLPLASATLKIGLTSNKRREARILEKLQLFIELNT